jgi:hypothetical protein
LLTRANPALPRIALIALDLPEFERPTTATSAPSSGGKSPGLTALLINTAFIAAVPKRMTAGRTRRHET